jgi:hypothetical protein
MKKLILAIVFPVTAFAYIPQIDMIFDRTVKNQGKGTYIVDAEVTIDSKGQTFLARESWLVEDVDNMRVKVVGEKEIKTTLNLIRIYKNGKRYFMDDDNNVKTLPLPEDFLEPLFYIRTQKRFENNLLAYGILPQSYTKMRKPTIDINEPKYLNPSFLKLSRAGGLPSYFIGQSTTMGPGLWIEQDEFVIRRLRLSNQSEVFADEYQKYANSIMLPQLRTVKWGGNQAKIRILNVRSVAMTPKIKEMFSNKTFSEEKGKKESIDSVPEDPILKDFYTRFR